jgi:putative acetyltransferase
MNLSAECSRLKVISFAFRRARMEIVEAAATHRTAIAALNRAAFGGDAEPQLVSRLREEGAGLVELAALDRGEVIGHILFSQLTVEIDGRAVKAAALAPMAVRPDRQREGVGSELIRQGVEALRISGCEAVFVLGHPAYYRRFGFSAALARKFAAPFTGEAFMAIELIPGALAGNAGSVSYPAAFSLGCSTRVRASSA